ncbi:NACHT domain-containing protein [Glycomyces xiaoerkulensis]|uniref:ATP-binding protein n=1 Tax=Glycomyces xiaoerkulensis TaxID=2038139 RepID=UPI000C25B627|nr:ATP-binding protein [Glycomyces xiaoerkulensis]
MLEHRYGAVLLTHLLTGVPLPALGADVASVEVTFQAPATHVDDFRIRGSNTTGFERELNIAMRRRPTLKLGDEDSVRLFRSFLAEIERHREDLGTGHWRLALAMEGPAGLAHDLAELTGCARSQPNAQEFRDHVASRRSKSLQRRLQQLDKMVATASQQEGAIDDLTWRLLSALYIVELRLDDGRDADRAGAVTWLSNQITDGNLDAASRYFDRMLDLASSYAPVGAQVDRSTLAARLGLTPRSLADTGLDEFVQRFLSHRSPDLSAAVPVSIKASSGAELATDALTVHLKAQHHIHIVGPSGSGKTIALVQIASQLAQTGWLPVWISARLYGPGGLRALLDEAVATYSARDAQALIQGAKAWQRSVALLVDGINECPADLQTRLLHELNAMCLREPITVITTGQAQPDAPEPLGGTTWLMKSPSPEQRNRIIEANGADPSDPAFAPFEQPLELALAAKLLGDLPPRAGTGTLLDAYIRERASGTNRPTTVRAVLRSWARTMDQQLRGAITLGEAERCAASAGADSFDDVLASGLIQVQGQHVAFTHEQYQRLLAAEALLLDHGTDTTAMVSDLSSPDHADLVKFALALASDFKTIQAIMTAIPQSSAFSDALRGRLGTPAEQVMDREARRLLQRTASIFEAASLHFQQEYQVEISPSFAWSAYDHAIFAAIGEGLHDGILFRECLQLLDATDTAFASATVANSAPARVTLANHIGYALAGLSRSGSERLPTGLILEACRLTFNRFHSAVTLQQFEQLTHGLEPNRYSRIALACLLVSRTSLPEAAELALTVARCAWDSGAYHLQLAIFDMLMFVRLTAQADERRALEEFLECLQPGHLFLNDALIECLHAYGLVDSPHSPQDIADDIRQLLSSPDSNDTFAQAYHIFVSQFEPVIGPPFVEAIDALEPDQINRLAALAGRCTEALVWKDVILEVLLDANDPIAIPAFRLWAASLAKDTMQPQDDVAAYVISVLGLASHMSPLPPLTHLSGSLAEAWSCYGQVLWYLHHPSLTNREVTEQCRPLWQRLIHELHEVAAEPLFWISHTFRSPVKGVLRKLLMHFPEQVRTVLEHGITQSDRHLHLTRWPEQLDHLRRYIQLLSKVGNQATMRLLASMAHDPELGNDAATAARQLSSTSTPERNWESERR